MTVLATFMPVCLAFLPLAKSNPASQVKKARQKQARASASEKGNGHHATSHDPPATDTTWLLQGLRPVDTRAGGGNGAPLAADADGDDRRGDRVVMPTPLFYSPYFVAALLVLQLLTTASGALLPGADLKDVNSDVVRVEDAAACLKWLAPICFVFCV